jgi:hypothetical protein
LGTESPAGRGASPRGLTAANFIRIQEMRMILFTREMLDTYMTDDITLRQLNAAAADDRQQLTSHVWLLNSPPKRMIFQQMYGDLLAGTSTVNTVLDVGGGYTSLTRTMLKRYGYALLDIMAHDDHALLRKIEADVARDFWIGDDWDKYACNDGWDLVIANDLFPNVDQRLDLFLEKYLPRCRELRITFTYYNTQRWYKVKRVDGEEIFHMVAWDGVQVKRVLEKYADRVLDPNFDLLLQNPASMFDNKRQLAMATLQGDLAEPRVASRRRAAKTCSA